MSIEGIARMAFIKVERLERLLIKKGVIKLAEADEEELKAAEERKQTQERNRIEFWAKIQVGYEITFAQPYNLKTILTGAEGIVVAKSEVPFSALVFQVTKGDKPLKVGQIYTERDEGWNLKYLGYRSDRQDPWKWNIA
jgi:hypothetical protein